MHVTRRTFLATVGLALLVPKVFLKSETLIEETLSESWDKSNGKWDQYATVKTTKTRELKYYLNGVQVFPKKNSIK